MDETANVVALVLAAGSGARFGAGNKLLAEIDGRPLLRRAVTAALASRARRTLVVTGHAREAVETALAGLDVGFVHNPDHATGMASSLRAGLLAATGADAVVVLLGDMPGVTPALIDALISAFDAAPGAPAVVPVHQNRRGNPVLLARALFPALDRLAGDTGARRLLADAPGVVEVAVDDPGVSEDVDSPADLDRLREALRRS
jgi:molybdenum cofactor cytidylyltransferase